MRQPRFLVTNLPAEGYARVAYRICRFLGTSSILLPLEGKMTEVGSLRSESESLQRNAQCAPMLELPNNRAHSSVYVRANCEDELVRGILADPPQELRRIKLEQLLPNQVPAAARRRSVRYRRRMTVHTDLGVSRGNEVLSACTLLRSSGSVNADAPVLAFSRHSSTMAFSTLITELETRFAPDAHS